MAKDESKTEKDEKGAGAGIAEVLAQVQDLANEVASLSAGLEQSKTELAATKAELAKARRDAAGAKRDASKAQKAAGDTKTFRVEAIQVDSVTKAREYLAHQVLQPGKIQNSPPGFTVRALDLALPKSEQARLRAKFGKMGFVRLPIEDMPVEQHPFMPGMNHVEWWVADEAVEAEFKAARFEVRRRVQARFKRSGNKALQEEIRKIVAEQREAG